VSGARTNRVWAAGGIVRDEEVVVVVHRPRYDDWSFPKGKLLPGEGFEAAALREVREETGLRCELVEELTPVEYLDRIGRPKLVRYWLMRSLGGAFEPSREVDELRWLPPREATALLSYEHDRALLETIRGDPR
jgi:8-oxo-dGTP diphosphatase